MHNHTNTRNTRLKKIDDINSVLCCIVYGSMLTQITTTAGFRYCLTDMTAIFLLKSHMYIQCTWNMLWFVNSINNESTAPLQIAVKCWHALDYHKRLIILFIWPLNCFDCAWDAGNVLPGMSFYSNIMSAFTQTLWAFLRLKRFKVSIHWVGFILAPSVKWKMAAFLVRSNINFTLTLLSFD